ncbi:hypothetical protein JYU34_015569 [Plutella xylostella]|uniref:Arb2 domain-containing protein n=1 Tax=Plutella xylostella TaxID=51655 RepID=A0ABQ7Q480_PLUXY|nr:hypothetical protein JYU34_015569 [Plutella xylostella]
MNYKKESELITIKDYGYGFNSLGELRQLDGKKEKYSYDQLRLLLSPTDRSYQCRTSVWGPERIRQNFEKAMKKYVKDYVIEKFKYTKLPVPEGSWEKTGTYALASHKYFLKDTLLVFVTIDSAIWDDWLLSQNLYKYSMIPYFQHAKDRGYGVVSMQMWKHWYNWNDYSHRVLTGQEYAEYVWDHYISKSQASAIVIIGHSGASEEVTEMAVKKKEDFKRRVKAVALLGGSPCSYRNKNPKFPKYYARVTKHWKCDKSLSLGVPLEDDTEKTGINTVSAGTNNYREAPHLCMEAALKFIDKKLKKFYETQPKTHKVLLPKPTQVNSRPRKKCNYTDDAYEDLKDQLDYMDHQYEDEL